MSKKLVGGAVAILAVELLALTFLASWAKSFFAVPGGVMTIVDVWLGASATWVAVFCAVAWWAE